MKMYSSWMACNFRFESRARARESSAACGFWEGLVELAAATAEKGESFSQFCASVEAEVEGKEMLLGMVGGRFEW